MSKGIKNLLSIVLVLFFIVFFSAQAKAEVEAPKIIKLTAQNFLSLNGTSPVNSEVLIYLDGSLIGQAEASALDQTTAGLACPVSADSAAFCRSSWHFQYNPNPRFSDGTHSVMAVAKDKTSLVLSAPTEEIKFAINAVPAPTLIAPNEKTVTADPRPLIVGLTRDNTLVKIFIDGVLNGETVRLRDDSGTADFSLRPPQNLSRGFHKISAVAEDDAGLSSSESEVLTFKIELPFPAPTIFNPVINQDTSLSRPFIVGLAKNDSKIKVYIDEKYNGELTVKNHSSGTANFAYKPKAALARGVHKVYTVAVDKRGKASIQSNQVSFSTKNAAISESVQEERKDVVVNIREPEQSTIIEPNSIIISSSSGAVVQESGEEIAGEVKQPAPAELKTESINDNDLTEKQDAIKRLLADQEKAASEKVSGLIGEDRANSENDGGMVNEDKQNQGRLKLSVILFILFLVGVVAWLLWVNRELVKERRAQNEAEEKAKDNKNTTPTPGGEQKDKLL